MSEQPKDGGTVFPSSRIELVNPSFPENAVGRHVEVTYPGMSLRDYFAALYVCGRAARPDGVDFYSDTAECAYAMADAMLKARDAK